METKPVVMTFAAKDLHLVVNPLVPAYSRYYDFVGLVTPTSPTDPVDVCVYGIIDQYDGQRWALRRKDRQRG